MSGRAGGRAGALVRGCAQYHIRVIIPSPGLILGGRVAPGAVLLAVDGERVADLPPQQLAVRVLGPRGSRVRLTLRFPAPAEGGAGGACEGGGGEVEVELARDDGEPVG